MNRVPADPRDVASADDSVDGFKVDGFKKAVALARPPRDAVELAEVHRSLRANMLERRSPPLHLDRYEVRRFLGAGGHGSVYEAFDPKLERRVAIKILKSQAANQSSAGQLPSSVSSQNARLLEEARAIARACDPRVVAVYDVSECSLEFLAATGEDRDAHASVFMVMEYVEGQTLGRWIEDVLPSLGEMLRVFLEAARGLEAAHRALVVHGDFKPENVLITRDGQVKILDFGIARTTSRTFRLGVFAGTRGYASPEQVEGQAIDERSDQYSFCVALHEALHGTRRRTNVASAAGREAAKVPNAGARALLGRLDRALARGLRKKAAARYRSMGALIAALERASRRTPLPVRLVSAMFASLLALAPAAVERSAGVSSADCIQDRLGPIWEPARAARLERALYSTGLPYVADSWRSVSKELESYAARFRESARAACSLDRAGSGAGLFGGPGALLASRPELGCLEERQRALGSLLDVTEQRPNEVLPRILDAVFSLEAPGSCLALAGRSAGPARPTAECAAAVEAELYALEAVLVAGAANPDSVRRSDAMQRQAEACSDDKLRARAALVQGLHLLSAQDFDQAARSLRRAFLLAESTGDARTAIRAMSAEIVAHDELGGDTSLVDRLVDDATARVNLSQETLAPDLQASFLEEISGVRRNQGRYAEAQKLAERAVSLRDHHWGSDHPLAWRSRMQLARVYYKQRNFRDAEALGLLVLRNTEAWVGPKHPDTAAAGALLGNIAWRRGQYDRAQRYFADNELFWGEVFGFDSDRTVPAILARASVHNSAAEFALAWEKVEPLLRRSQRGELESHLETWVLCVASEALAGLGRYKEAEVLLDHATLGMVERLGADHADIAEPLLARGRLELLRGNANAAIGHCHEAVEHWRKLGENHPKLSWAYACLGLAELESGMVERARSTLERSLSLFDPDVDDPNNLAEIEFALARALETSDRTRALVLAEQAARRYQGAPTHQQDARTVTAWRDGLLRRRNRP